MLHVDTLWFTVLKVFIMSQTDLPSFITFVDWTTTQIDVTVIPWFCVSCALSSLSEYKYRYFFDPMREIFDTVIQMIVMR